MSIKAIETQYKGYRFRSRLEARWAVFFDALGIKWEYEKEGYDLDGVKYLPDFWLPHHIMADEGWGYWVEIKPLSPSDGEVEKLVALVKSTHHTAYLFVGPPQDGTEFVYVNHSRAEPRRGRIECGLWDDGAYWVRFANLTDPDSWIKGFQWAARYFIAWPEFIEASTAARSARFEHGETPNVRSIYDRSV